MAARKPDTVQCAKRYHKMRHGIFRYGMGDADEGYGDGVETALWAYADDSDK